MKLASYIDDDLVLPDLSAGTKEGVLAELVRPLAEKLNRDGKTLYDILVNRENLGTTGIGEGVAIPHGKADFLDELYLVVGRSRNGVDFAALDHKPVYIIFLLLAPEKSAGKHLKLLAFISKLLLDQEFRRGFMDAAGRQELAGYLKSV
ncbi:MAG: PTS sugar transporter subunit IIA [Desulfonatronovibrionaceae bacterium]